MSKRRISSDLFDVFPSSFLKKTKQNEVISPIQQEKDPFFQTQDIIRHPMPLNSKLIMTKMAFPSSSTFLKPEAFIKTNKEDDIMNSLFNINEYNDKSSFFYKDNQNNDKNSLSNFNYNPQNIPNFESFLQQSPPVPPLTVNLHAYFSFPYFNKVQTKCLFPLLFSNENMVISAPTGSGKTVLFEIAILKQYLENPPKTSKTIYLSPIKALCQEKNQEWAEKFSPFGLSLLELTGDSGEIEEQEAFHKSSIIITTPEKWDSITRKWHGNELLLSQVTLILIDEVHLLNTEERGATLEAVISRMKLISSRKQAKKLRIIALSATIPNIEDIAAWLEVPPLGVRRFGEEYRPVALEKHVLGYNRSKSEFLFEKSLNYRLLEIIRRYAEKKPVLVFCQTQKGTMAACEQLIVDGHEREFVNSDEHLKVLVEQGSRVGDPQLKKFILAGVAFHNARLKPEDRRVVEGLFKERLISVICTTSTLAQGVNLPARLVIIKSTVCYRGAGVGYSDYSHLEIEQMMGRAGRPQYDTKGVVVLMTQRDKVEKFQGNSLMKEDLESHFGKKLAENLNAEVALGSIKDIQNAVDYVKSTFYYIRLKKNPEFYGCKRNEVIEEYLEEACKKLLQEMQEYDLLQFEKTKIRSLELGCEMSRFYVVFATIKKLFLEFNGKNGDGGLEKVLRVLSQATEFEGFRSKLEERGKLKILNERNKFKVKGAISTFDKKSFVLLQSWVQRENIEDWELMRDSTEMVGLHWRILSCFKKFFLKRKQPDNLIATIKLCKYIGARTWEDNPLTILRQIPGIGEKFAKILKDSRIDSFEKVLGCNNGMLEMLCGKNAPFGENIRGFVKKIPNIEIRLKGKNGRKISFEVQNLHSKENEEICNAFLIFYNRNKSVFLFKFLDLKRVGGQIMEFDILLGADISNLPLKIAVLNEKFIGFDRNYILDKDFNFFENTKEEEKIRKEEEFDKKIQKEYNDSELIDELLEDFYNKEKKDGKKKEKTFINNNNSLNLEKNKKTQEIGGINYNTSGIIRENLENNIPEIAKSSNFKKEEQNINNNYLKPQEKEAKLTSRNQKINQKTIKWFQEKQNYQEFYSLFEDIF